MVLTTISWVADALILGFVPTALLLLASKSLWTGYRRLINQLTIFANTLLLVGALLLLLMAARYIFISIASGDEYEQYAMINRITGPYWFAYTGAVLCKGGLPQLLWLRRLRHSLWVSGLLLPFLSIDFWLPALYSLMSHRDYLPSSWSMQSNLYTLLATSLAYLLLYALLFTVARKLGLVASTE